MTKISQIVTKNAGASALLGGGAPVVSLSGNPAIYYVNIDATSGDLLEITLLESNAKMATLALLYPLYTQVNSTIPSGPNL